ncbi:unnamed protein product [Spirodela intermedia]|uniref:BHLH domain-containing protein n=1 Tax=Spirodela intermedia TaxID=51605 RepID=A0A7I8JQC7_SPIIN|nr:unnamed protein product [Spirodela intermedia]CAA6672330.1 unnamed protein product [Spirodela intermedia]
MPEELRFREIRRAGRERESAADNGSGSFTALLGLPASRAIELLHEVETGRGPLIPFSVFATEDSPRMPSSAVCSAEAVKTERPDSDSNPNSPLQQRPPKRKGHCDKKNKLKASGKRPKSRSEGGISKTVEENDGGEEEKLPYVHVRARRGQATDSHSLAERARREKINARMKLLQELVPGCNKISGTAQVLDEIINHVQSLQRQVEFLSMRLAAVNPGIDFAGLDSFLAANGGAPRPEQPALWPEAHRPVRLADILPKPVPQSLWGSGVVVLPGNPTSAATL